MNILVVDDNPIYLGFLKESLTLNGYRVFAADGGAEACKILARPDIDLIISDINMPTLDGLMLHSYARDLELYKNTKFIFISGCGEAYEDVLSLDPEIDFFIDKTSTPVSDMLKFVDTLMLVEHTDKIV